MRKFVPFLLAASLALAACGGGGGAVAASVGDTEITVGDVRSFPFEQADTIEPAVFAQYLGALIQWQVLDDAAAADYGIDPTEEEMDAELTEVLETIGNDQTLAEIAEVQNLSEETVRKIVRVGLIQEQVLEELSGGIEEPTDDEVEVAIAAEISNLTEVCTRHVLVATEDEALEVKERLEAGEDIAEVAAEVSTDPSAAENQGDMGCVPASNFVPEYGEAAVAAELETFTDPVETQFGFHIIEVYDRTEPSEDALPSAEDIAAALTEQNELGALEAWLQEKVGNAEVTIDEEYGTWQTDPTPQVVPPST